MTGYKTLQDNIKEACTAYKDFCALKKNKHRDSISIVDLIEYFEDQGISILKNDGEENSHAGLRLGLNKYIGKVKRVGVVQGQWKDMDEANKVMKGLFKTITSPPTLKGGMPDWF